MLGIAFDELLVTITDQKQNLDLQVRKTLTNLVADIETVSQSKNLKLISIVVIPRLAKKMYTCLKFYRIQQPFQNISFLYIYIAFFLSYLSKLT